MGFSMRRGVSRSTRRCRSGLEHKRRSSRENRRLSHRALPTHHFRVRLPLHAEENRHPLPLISGTPRGCKAPTERNDRDSETVSRATAKSDSVGDKDRDSDLR